MDTRRAEPAALTRYSTSLLHGGDKDTPPLPQSLGMHNGRPRASVPSSQRTTCSHVSFCSPQKPCFHGKSHTCFVQNQGGTHTHQQHDRDKIPFSSTKISGPPCQSPNVTMQLSAVRLDYAPPTSRKQDPLGFRPSAHSAGGCSIHYRNPR